MHILQPMHPSHCGESCILEWWFVCGLVGTPLPKIWPYSFTTYCICSYNGMGLWYYYDCSSLWCPAFKAYSILNGYSTGCWVRSHFTALDSCPVYWHCIEALVVLKNDTPQMCVLLTKSIYKHCMWVHNVSILPIELNNLWSNQEGGRSCRKTAKSWGGEAWPFEAGHPQDPQSSYWWWRLQWSLACAWECKGQGQSKPPPWLRSWST